MNYFEQTIDSKELPLGCQLTLKKKTIGRDTFFHIAIVDKSVNRVETILSTQSHDEAIKKFNFVYTHTI